jgi:hypothetical protein
MASMDSEPDYFLLVLASFAIIGGLSGVCAPDFWAKANKDFNGTFGLPVGPGGNPKFVRVWSGLAIAAGLVMVAIVLAQVVF